MIIFKCNMCGNYLEASEGASFVIGEHGGIKQDLLMSGNKSMRYGHYFSEIGIIRGNKDALLDDVEGCIIYG